MTNGALHLGSALYSLPYIVLLYIEMIMMTLMITMIWMITILMMMHFSIEIAMDVAI